MLINFGENELNRIREWFDSVQDVNPKYLESKDYDLAKRIYEALGQRVPDSVRTKCSDSPRRPGPRAEGRVR